MEARSPPELLSFLRRHEIGHQIFKFMGATAPSMGMIGTLIGLVQMLRALDDPATIGPAMAVALLTTFYGAVLAFLVFIPIAEKLKDRTQQEQIARELVIDGIKGIVRGLGPRVLNDRLVSFLAPSQRKSEEEEKAAA